MPTQTISEIWIYPIKSLPGIRLQNATVKEKGLHLDRRWMLVDHTGRFLTQREHPEMALFNLTFESDFLFICYKNSLMNRGSTYDLNSAVIKLDLEAELTGALVKVHIWKDEVTTIEVNPLLSAWFSKQLNFICKLVFFPENKCRNIDPEYAQNKEQVSLADAYPFLIIGQSSLNELNSRLPLPMTMQRFRPNFVFINGLPHAEDSWKNFKIGRVNFEGVKPCARCVLTTVNPETGEKGLEPLKTLSGYRVRNGKVIFGGNLIGRNTGEVCVGDLIEVIDFKSPLIKN